MKVKTIRRQEPHLIEGVVVVIDVIRAFTTTAFAFAAGAKEIILVGEVDEAFKHHRENNELVLVGEVNAAPIPGFHFCNSPAQMKTADLKGKTLVLRTSSGTQGVMVTQGAEAVLASSFVVAEATIERIKELAPKAVTMMVTGTNRGGAEDFALADYLTQRLQGNDAFSKPYLQQVIDSPTGQLHFSGEHPYFPKEDLDAVLLVDHFPFATEVFRENGLFILRPVGKRKP